MADGSPKRVNDGRTGMDGLAQRLLGKGERNVGSMERLASLAAGGVLAALALKRRGVGGMLLGAAATSLLHRGATGYCVAYGGLGVSTAEENGFLERQHGSAAVLDASKAIKVEETIMVARDREELYRFWRQLENLPRIMNHLEDVTVLDETHSLWTAKAPVGQTVQWEAEIHNEIPGQLIGWRSVHEATVPNAGSVHFSDAPGGGTTIRVVLEYMPPAGVLGMTVAKLFGEEPSQQVRDDLRKFKEAMESGASLVGMAPASAESLA